MHCGETVGTERIRCKITSVQGGDTITASGESIRLASNESVEPAAILMQASGMKPETAYVDLGYRGVDKDNLGLGIKPPRQIQETDGRRKKSLQRRQAIEPVIGHKKADHRIKRCHLTGSKGESLHAVLCASGFNNRWLLRMIAKKASAFFGACHGSAVWGTLAVNWQRFLSKNRPSPAQCVESWLENEFFGTIKCNLC
jgi:hypothetical protein